MSWTLCTSGAAIRKAGVNANSDIIASGAALQEWSEEAEAEVSSLARFNVVAGFSALTGDGKKVFSQITSSMIAQMIINYDIGGYSSNREAETLLDVNENVIDRTTKIITEQKNKSYLGVSS